MKQSIQAIAMQWEKSVKIAVPLFISTDLGLTNKPILLNLLFLIKHHILTGIKLLAFNQSISEVCLLLYVLHRLRSFPSAQGGILN